MSRLAVTLSTALLLAAPAHAGDPAVANQHKAAADQAFLREDYAGALRLLERAYAEDPQPRFVANMGLVLEKMGRFAEAVAALERFLATEPPYDKAEAAERVVHRLKPWLRITTEPAGAKVTVDGRAVGRSPLQARVLVGQRTVQAHLPGHADARQQVEIVPGEVANVQLTLPKKAEAATPAPPPRALAPAAPRSPPRQRDLRLWAYVAWGAAALSAGGAGVMYAVGSQAIDARDDAGDAATWDEENDRAAAMQTGAIAAGALAGALAVGGAVLFFLDDDAGGFTVAPAPGGAAFGVRF
ncbi:MAG: PEGA domain-containing protein [Myxococcales bacterium]|nr:PEGA domain-containing protein [Myxococcales bacterium]